MNPSEIRLTGGGSQSPAWRQIAADIFNAEVVTLATAEGAALGAAIQAAFATMQAAGKERDHGGADPRGWWRWMKPRAANRTRRTPRCIRGGWRSSPDSRGGFTKSNTSEAWRRSASRIPGKPIAWLIRAICGTLRFRVVDHAGLNGLSMDQRTWIFWHNRMFIFPWLHQTLFPGRGGAVLTSASGDGQIIADVCSEFGFRPVRGSSSRRGAQALMELADCIRAGEDIGITPDGPRGPRYPDEHGRHQAGATHRREADAGACAL